MSSATSSETFSSRRGLSRRRLIFARKSSRERLRWSSGLRFRLGDAVEESDEDEEDDDEDELSRRPFRFLSLLSVTARSEAMKSSFSVLCFLVAFEFDLFRSRERPRRPSREVRFSRDRDLRLGDLERFRSREREVRERRRAGDAERERRLGAGDDRDLWRLRFSGVTERSCLTSARRL